MCSVVTVISGVCNSVRLSQLLVVTILKLSIIPMSNPKPPSRFVQVTMHTDTQGR
jgi:hypothetical protein